MHARNVIIVTLALGASTAEAHVSISSGPAAANKSQKITFSVGHGCEGDDTLRVRVTIPSGTLANVRALHSDFGAPVVERDIDGNATAVEWEKPAGDLLPADDGYYELVIRARVPDAAFTRIAFTVEQTCRDDEDDTETVVMWDGIANDAPTLTVVPARVTGWNRYTIPAAIAEDEVPTYFGDAQIVWRGAEAYSPNSLIAAVIATTTGVTPLTGGLAAGDDVWVKY